MFPEFKIKAISKTDKGMELIGNISSNEFDGEKWIDDKWLGFLKENSSLFYGRWHKHNNNWKFVVSNEELLKTDFYEGQVFSAIDGYWGERIELIIDKNITWRETVYKFTADDNHEHCFFCWVIITEYENNKYMLANELIAVCLVCYETYVKKESFDFIVVPKK